MRIHRIQALNLAFVAIGFLATAILYPRLPDPVPTHWNLRGQVDGFTPKPWGPFIMPLVMAGLYLLLLVLPRISPRGFRIDRFQRVFELLQTTIMGFLFLITVLVLATGAGAPLRMDLAIQAGMGVLFVVLGNFLGKVTRNFFVGIRTPWTLASDEVWLRTHRLGGKLFVLAGAAMLVSALLGGGLIPFLVALGVATVIPVVYSYLIYRRIEGFKNGPGNDERPAGT